MAVRIPSQQPVVDRSLSQHPTHSVHPSDLLVSPGMMDSKLWSQSASQYREKRPSITAGGYGTPDGHSPLPSSPPYHHEHSASPAHRVHDTFQPRSPITSSVNESGPGPSTWANMQQRESEEKVEGVKRNASQGSPPSELIQGVRLGNREDSYDGRRASLADDSGNRQHISHRSNGHGNQHDHNSQSTHRSTRNDASEDIVMADGNEEEPRRPSVAKMDTYEDRARPKYSDGRLGVLSPVGKRQYSVIKIVGDGSFGTVWLCDWKSELAPTTVLSAMQCGAGARPEWTGKRLVAVKRMKRVWEGGWTQASKLGELVSLREIPHHPAIIPLYDAFLEPDTKELYFVFECMEGNLYQLTKSRKGRNLAGGLIASIFHQIIQGLDHIHTSGYFHRDLKPENLLVTTTGLQSYMPVVDPEWATVDKILVHNGKPPMERPKPKIEKDVTVIVKLADFGLARSLSSAPPYTEYVSTRWYRAPEVLLRSKEYSAPVDMWALGTILAELLNLKALFPGQSEVDQVWRICEVMGDPSPEYGHDERGFRRGGGEWLRGIKMAKNVGFAFPKKQPVLFMSLFSPGVPITLIDCIRQMLRYNPRHRITAADCLQHPYFKLVAPHLQGVAELPQIPLARGQPLRTELDQLLQVLELQRMKRVQDAAAQTASVPPRLVPPSHSHSPPYEKPSFNMSNSDTARMLPPPVVSPQHRSYQPSPDRSGQRMDGRSTPGGASSSQTFLPDLSRGNNGASALVDQLRELDLPTADLSTYGQRRWPSRRGSRDPSVAPSAVPRHESEPMLAHHANASAPAINAQRQSMQPSAAHLPAHLSNPQFHPGYAAQQPGMGYSGSSAPELAQAARSRAPHHDEDVIMEDMSEEPQSHQMSTNHPYRGQQPPAQSSRMDDLAAGGKKKKWGLSSVFGGNNDSKVAHAPPPPGNIASSHFSVTNLKRTQEEVYGADRNASVITLPPGLDPKKAKKELERLAKEQDKELQRAKREAMARAQKERARAVMAKRDQLVQHKQATGDKSDIDWRPNAEYNAIDTESLKTNNTSNTSVQGGTGAGQRTPSVKSLSNTDLRMGRDPYHAAMAISASRSQPVVGADPSPHLSQGTLAVHQQHLDISSPDSYRQKARKRDEWDDHSVSSYATGYRSNLSLLSVGTIDSDPGPASSPRVYQDPSHRAASVSSFARSNVSLDGRLVRDFRNTGITSSHLARSSASLPYSDHDHRNGGSSSSLSLGQYASSTSLSGPTTPYNQGHPLGHAVAVGHGSGRSQYGNMAGVHPQVLPSIQAISKDWDGQDIQMDGSHTMRSGPPGNLDGGMTTLPPFAQIASIADSQGKGQSQQQQQQQRHA